MKSSCVIYRRLLVYKRLKSKTQDLWPAMPSTYWEKRKMDEWNISPPLSNSLILCNEKKIVECLILQKPFILIIKKQKISLPCCLPSMIEYSQLIGELKQKNFKRFYKCQVVILKKKKDNWTLNKLTAFVFQKFANSLRASL